MNWCRLKAELRERRLCLLNIERNMSVTLIKRYLLPQIVHKRLKSNEKCLLCSLERVYFITFHCIIQQDAVSEKDIRWNRVSSEKVEKTNGQSSQLWKILQYSRRTCDVKLILPINRIVIDARCGIMINSQEGDDRRAVFEFQLGFFTFPYARILLANV